MSSRPLAPLHVRPPEVFPELYQVSATAAQYERCLVTLELVDHRPITSRARPARRKGLANSRRPVTR
jgi:hypothetical protein